jgi:hypothetical protein
MSENKALEIVERIEDGEKVTLEVDPSEDPESVRKEVKRIRRHLKRQGATDSS